MSQLDKMYKNYREFCEQEYRTGVPAILIQLVLFSDGSGRVEKKLYLPTDANPFKVNTVELIHFKSPADAAKQLEEKLGKKDLSKVSRESDTRNVETVYST